MTGEPAHVHFVDDGPGPGVVERDIALPVELAGINDHTLHCPGGILSRLAGRVATVARGHDDALPVRIEKHLTGVETEASLRLERASDAVAINLPRSQAGDEDVPVVIGPVLRRIEGYRARRAGVVRAVEEEQFDRPGVPGIDAEVDAVRSASGPEGEAFSLPHTHIN
jgi:hypothetical protein